MIDPLKTVAGILPTAADTSGNHDGTPPGSAAPEAKAASATPPPAPSPTESLRLVVEAINGGSDYTYKLFDRATGELVMELPSGAAAKMSESPDYSAGQVIDATA